jgi:hypothetical protein
MELEVVAGIITKFKEEIIFATIAVSNNPAGKSPYWQLGDLAD